MFKRNKHTASDSPSKESYFEREYLVTKIIYERFRKYQKWLTTNFPKTITHPADIESHKKSDTIKFSVILPIYNTPPGLLRECIESVFVQTYTNWELCIVDDHSESESINKICDEYKKEYPSKIKYKYRSKNGHISNASNDAIAVATGNYLVLLDHDDLLWPNALQEIADAIDNDNSLDLIYTDEDLVDETNLHDLPFLKPDFNAGYLEGCNYITHLAAIRTSLVRSIGCFRNGVEGAQDWDLFLRLSNETSNIHHIPKITYSWRMTETSTALSGFLAKPYAHDAQKKALLDHYRDKKIQVEDLKLHTNYVGWMTSYALKSTQRINVIITKADSAPTLIDRIEKARDGSMATKYFIYKDSTEKHLKLSTNIKYQYVNLLDDVETNCDFILYLSNIKDLIGEDGWLNNAIGDIKFRGYDAIAPSIRLDNHFVVSAGIVKDSRGNNIELLNGYVEGGDRRLDTNLLTPRDVQLPDKRAFICRTQIFKSVLNKNFNKGRTLYTPFFRCFVDLENSDTSEASKDAFSYNLSQHTPYWYIDYLSE